MHKITQEKAIQSNVLAVNIDSPKNAQVKIGNTKYDTPNPTKRADHALSSRDSYTSRLALNARRVMGRANATDKTSAFARETPSMNCALVLHHTAICMKMKRRIPERSFTMTPSTGATYQASQSDRCLDRQEM